MVLLKGLQVRKKKMKLKELKEIPHNSFSYPSGHETSISRPGCRMDV